MSDDRLVSEYRAAAIDHYQATLEMRTEDTVCTGEALLRTQTALMGLKDWPVRLRPLLSDADRRVRLDAACCLLPTGNWRAWFILHWFSSVIKNELGLGAKMRLHVWKDDRR